MDKKKYIAPSSEVIAFRSESLMITQSVDVDGEKTLDGSKGWSNHRGWSSDDWTGVDEEEE